MKQTVVLGEGKVFLREGWYPYDELRRILQAAGQKSNEPKRDTEKVLIDEQGRGD